MINSSIQRQLKGPLLTINQLFQLALTKIEKHSQLFLLIHPASIMIQKQILSVDAILDLQAILNDEFVPTI